MQKKKPISYQSKHTPLIKYTRSLLRKVNKAFNEFNLINEGDKVCVAVSGGKDSLSLLHLLIQHRRFFPMKYNIEAVHVVSDFEPDAEKTKIYIRKLFDSFEIPSDFIDISVTVDKDGNKSDPSCFWCAWNRRETLFKYCVKHGFNKLAFGHHFDDVAETTLLNLFYHANLETMLPLRSFFDGKFDVIRPLFYVKERETLRLARMAGFSFHTCTCEYADSGKRQVMKSIVRTLEKKSKYLHNNLWRASKTWHETFDDRPCHPEPKETQINKKSN